MYLGLSPGGSVGVAIKSSFSVLSLFKICSWELTLTYKLAKQFLAVCFLKSCRAFPRPHVTQSSSVRVRILASAPWAPFGSFWSRSRTCWGKYAAWKRNNLLLSETDNHRSCRFSVAAFPSRQLQSGQKFPALSKHLPSLLKFEFFLTVLSTFFFWIPVIVHLKFPILEAIPLAGENLRFCLISLEFLYKQAFIWIFRRRKDFGYFLNLNFRGTCVQILSGRPSFILIFCS